MIEKAEGSPCVSASSTYVGPCVNHTAECQQACLNEGYTSSFCGGSDGNRCFCTKRSCR